jgi:hypothetical protein
MKRYESYFTEASRELKKTKFKKGNFIKEIVLYASAYSDKTELIIDTESPAPSSVRGVKSSLVRKSFPDEAQGTEAFDKAVKSALSKGWEIWVFRR